MTRYRIRAVLLLFLVLHLTACYTWQGIATTSPAQLIEATQPDRVRVTMRGGTQVELERPVVDGDELVAPGDRSVSLEDVLMLEFREFNFGKTIGLSALWFVGGFALAFLGDCAITGFDHCGPMG